MELRFVLLAVAALVAISGCGTRSSANAFALDQPWEGPVFVSQTPLPAGIEHKILGSVQANARAGYDSAASLYPLIAAEAKKLGANAIFATTGGRRMTAFSWSAAYVSGTAVRVADPEKLKGLPGSYH